MGCKKEESIGGTGEIKGQSFYNGKATKTSNIYNKYGSQTSPGSDVSKYDSSIIGDSDRKFNFKELKSGDYYIHVVIMENGQIFTGGEHVALGNNEIKDNLNIEVYP